ncbi:MAG: DUF6377 domain-containing protein [Paenibacillus sp.]|nr:DUF6377 domain-containing protein [Paenibacillus sp.]
MKTSFSVLVMGMFISMTPMVHASEISSSNRGMLERLDKLVANRQFYIDKRKAKADSVKSLIEASPRVEDKIPLYQEYGDIWLGLSTDSAISAYNEGIKLCTEIADTTSAQKLYIARAHGYFLRGHIHESMSELTRVNETGLMPGVAEPFHTVGYSVFLTLSGFYGDQEDWAKYTKTGREHALKEMSLYDPESPKYHYCQALVYMADGKKQLMSSCLHDVVENTTYEDRINPYAYTLLGEYYMERGDYNEAVYNYAMASIGNVECAHLDGVALLRLGEMLYRMGDTSRAHNYLVVAMEKSILADMKFNLMRVNSAFMDVSKLMVEEKHHQLWLMSALVFVLLVMLILVAKIITNKRKEVKALKIVETRLANSNLAKETYIAEFMNLCSSYIESLEDYNKMSRRKITAGQTEELLAYIKSGKIVDEQRKKFYDVFDEALLHIFPTYVEDVNKLLQPDKQIVTPAPNVLTTELRILALSRLGIDDAPIIARFLGITTNTIYTYRNKLRTRAIDRSTFEEEAKKIGTM